LSRRKLGLEDDLGRDSNAPILKTISYNKGPGEDNLVDTMIRTDPRIRKLCFEYAYDYINNGRKLPH